jgi:hypothetical protein
MRDRVQVATLLPYTCGMILTLLDIMVSGNSGECRRSERCGKGFGTERISTSLFDDIESRLAAARGYRRPPARAGVRLTKLCDTITHRCRFFPAV